MSKNSKTVIGVIILIIAASLIMIATRLYFNKTVSQAISLKENFSCMVDITYGDLSAKASFTKSGQTGFNIAFTAPETLNGVEIICSGNDITIKYMGLTMDIDKNLLPSKAIINCISQVLNFAQLPEELNIVSSTDNTITAKGVAPEGEFEITVEKSTGLPVKITVPDIGFSAVFIQ